MKKIVVAVVVFGLIVGCGVETETTSSGVVIGNLEISGAISAANAAHQVTRPEVAIVAQTVGQTPKEPPPIFLANERGEATESFDCREKVFVYITGLPLGNHLIEGFWYNPAGELQEYTRYEFLSRGQPVWLWLELHPSPGKRLLGGGIDTEFLGKWKITIYLDGKPVGAKVFYIK